MPSLNQHALYRSVEWMFKPVNPCTLQSSPNLPSQMQSTLQEKPCSYVLMLMLQLRLVKGERGAGGVRDTGVEGTGSGIPKMAGSGRNSGKLCNCTIFCNLKSTMRQKPTSKGSRNQD